MANKCVKLKEFMGCQMDVIQRHLDEHKWLNQIPDADKGASDFIKKYGWIMREMYCMYACADREQCTLTKVTLETNKHK